MMFEGIVGQHRATEALEAAVGAGRLFPALVFHGPSGVGKLTTALALGRALLCGSAEPHPHERCPTCRRIDARSLRHPDVRVIHPETLTEFERGDAAPEGSSGVDVQERQAEAAANAAWSILIDRVRQALSFVHRPPAEGTRSVLILDQAHRLGAEAANALLKTLEEPPAHAVLVLLAGSVHALLPTIRSRCQAVPFQLLSRAEIAAFLQAHGVADPGEADLRAALSEGRIGAAQSLDLDDVRARRASLLSILETLLEEGDRGVAVARAEEMARSGDALEADLGIALTLLRDLMILRAPATAPLVNVDLAERLGRMAPRLGDRGPRLLADLEDVLEGLRRKGNRQLLVENLFLNLARPRSTQGARPIR